jgi:TetR/AcrR family transcriptional regulator, lmrAB and yxaGH operons repressor
MMKKGQSAKHRLTATAAGLFMRQGYHGTGLAQIVAESGAPKGSLYFHFPGGKEALALAAVEAAGARFSVSIAQVLQANPNPRDALLALSAMLGQWMEKSRFSEGCPITTVCLELVPQNEPVTATTNAIFASWQQHWHAHLVQAGLAEDEASMFATTIVAAFEGAFILARAERSTRPFAAVSNTLARLLHRV